MILLRHLTPSAHVRHPPTLWARSIRQSVSTGHVGLCLETIGFFARAAGGFGGEGGAVVYGVEGGAGVGAGGGGGDEALEEAD